LRTAFAHARELDKIAPGDVDEIIAATVATVRGLRQNAASRSASCRRRAR
jgi:hypothetical protein